MTRTNTGTTGAIPTQESPEFNVRKASLSDIPDLLKLINDFSARGIMLPRTEFEMAENIRDFTVVLANGRVAGCGALHFYTPHAAEIRSLAMDPQFQGGGGGRLLMEALIAEAQAFQVQDIFAFTYIPDFFRKLGFTEIGRDELPLKAWKDCLRCPKFQCCDEIAVIRHLDMGLMGVNHTHTRGSEKSAPVASPADVPFPILQKQPQI